MSETVNVQNAIVAQKQFKKCGNVVDCQKVRCEHTSRNHRYHVVTDSDGLTFCHMDKEYSADVRTVWLYDGEVHMNIDLTAQYE